MQGRKTHEQQVRILERKPDVADGKEFDQAAGRSARDPAIHTTQPEARQSEFPVSRGGLNQESDHNKHNHAGQSGHKAPWPTLAQQKH